MISQSAITELATKEQTTETNIAREYLQHLFLRSFYRKNGADKFLFKGGTAIRIIFEGSRYSEDLDFSIPPLSKKEIEDVLIAAFTDLRAEGGVTTELRLEEATPTSGGYFADTQVDILGFTVGMKSNLQIKHDPASLASETHVISMPLFVPAYSLMALETGLLVHEKIQALIERHKARDVFDAYFFGRSPALRGYIPRDEKTLHKIDSALDEVSDHDLEADLKPFLPRNYQSIIKQLKTALRRDLGITNNRS
jgi:predicted nucleotidyltransferase component of viral defense system